VLNPLEWKPEHRAGLLVATAAGAAVAVAVGYTRTRLRGETFIDWVKPGDVLFWALVGAIVVGAAIYCYRVSFTDGAATKNKQ